ncbi:hypothetical protein M5D96_012885, partial [Drosophila gunungcola]
LKCIQNYLQLYKESPIILKYSHETLIYELHDYSKIISVMNHYFSLSNYFITSKREIEIVVNWWRSFTVQNSKFEAWMLTFRDNRH